MRKLFGLFLLALAFLAPDLAQAANRFAVCATTCTWDSSSTAMWSTSSGGATGASAPGSGDVAIFDSATCVGGTTCTTTTSGALTIQELQFSTCTASTDGCILDFSANNNNITIVGGNGVTINGTGTRTLKMGNGTWDLQAAQGFWNGANCTNLTLNANSSTISFSSAVNNQTRFIGCGKTYNVVSFVAGGSGAISITGANTFNTLTFSGTARVTFPQGTTQTVTTLTNAGSSSTPVMFESDNPLFGAPTISSANNWTCNFCAFNRMTFSGGGTFSATNSLNLGGNSGITITAPSGGGGGGGRIIGG